MTVFCHALANLPTKANIDQIYLELVTDKIWRKWRDQVKSKSTQEIRYNPNIVMRTGSIQIGENTPCAFYTFYTVTQSMSKLFLVKYDEHFTWNLRKRCKTTANQWGNTVTVATCVCKCLHRRLSHILNVHLRGAQKRFPWLMSKQMWTKYKQSIREDFHWKKVSVTSHKFISYF